MAMAMDVGDQKRLPGGSDSDNDGPSVILPSGPVISSQPTATYAGGAVNYTAPHHVPVRLPSDDAPPYEEAFRNGTQLPVQGMVAAPYPQAGIQTVTGAPVMGVTPVQHVTVITDGQPQLRHRQRWATKLYSDCACCDDCAVCCYGFWCPICLTGQVAKRMGEHCCYGCFCPLPLRVQFRTTYGIEGSGCNDCCAAIWCTMCVGCQITRQMDIMGVPGPRFLCC